MPRPWRNASWRRRTTLCAAAVLVTLIVPCAAAGAHGAIPAPPGVSAAPLLEPLALTPAMRQWLTEHVPDRLGADTRMERLLAALQASSGGLELVYDPWATLTAAEVFVERRYNCLAFAHLIVALSRELGVESYYFEANGIERYRRDGDLVVLSGHVTAAWDEGPSRRVLELVAGPQFDYRNGRRITDQHALALHHVNLGADALRAGEVGRALPHLLASVTVAPEVGTPWLDLGVALRRSGDLDGAEAAYRRAIAVEPRAAAAYDNLYALMRARGRHDAADELLRLIERGGKRNPWLLLSLGDNLLAARDLDGALRFYRRARASAPYEAAPAAALASWHLAAGDLPQARRWWRRASKLDPAEPRLEELAVRLGESVPGAGGPAAASAAVPDGDGVR